MNKQDKTQSGGGKGIEWRSIPGYEGLYEVSNDGQVKRLGGTPKCHHERNLRPSNRHGYPTVALCKNGKPNSFEVHRLVTRAFIGKQGNLWVNHKNGNKTDNRLENLEYLTPGENTKHAYVIGMQPSRKGEGNGRSKWSGELVILVRKLAESGVSRKEICRRFGVSKTWLQNVITNQLWSHINE